MTLPVPDPSTPLSVLWERYNGVVLRKLADSTQRGYRYAWGKRVAPSLAHLPVGSLTTLDVEVAFASWTGGESTRGDALSVLSSLCAVAVKGGYIASNPCHGVERRREQAADVAGRALSLEEFDRLRALLPASGPYRRFVLAMPYTGCRLGEIAGLRLSDVDWEGRTLLVARTVTNGRVGPTKGRRLRVVPVITQLEPILREAAEGKGQHDYLFAGPRGGFINSKNLSRALNWHQWRDQVKTFAPGEPPLHWHDLRHTAAVFFFRAGLPAPDVQALLGHSTLLVTQMYADTRREAARRGGPLLSNFFSQSDSQLGGGESPADSGSHLGI
ncbi:site-specific integrase [Naasia sp. SYSU D00057]|uniref:tyrosine-type recombinase/integrase n=1 Tax=Naasia sp. SYSU D00057 TaxID=2817380 RepID=UPI001B303BC9|nr:site-specific integrase [Naasia sp. SYSU D00057]